MKDSMTSLFSGLCTSPFSKGCQHAGTEQGLALNLLEVRPTQHWNSWVQNLGAIKMSDVDLDGQVVVTTYVSTC